MPSHEYSRDWYSTFLDTIPEQQTDREIAFIARQMPLASYRDILDVCCGPGRHANKLALAGYRVVGIDSNAAAIERARKRAPQTATFREGDMRKLGALGETFDGVINLWASFGYFDDATNEEILGQIAAALRPGGRALIDVYNRDYMLSLPANDIAVRGGVEITTDRTWTGKRFGVRLQYSSGARDEFEWRLYTADELSKICAAAGLDTALACAWFDETLAASAEHARMQLVLERRAAR